jgi:hypothetical protein
VAERQTDAGEHFGRIAEALSREPGVTVAEGRGFGSGTLQVNGRIFAMVSRGRFVVKLPRARVDTLIASGTGLPFDAGKGRPMKEWVVASPSRDDRGPLSPVWPLARALRILR